MQIGNHRYSLIGERRASSPEHVEALLEFYGQISGTFRAAAVGPWVPAYLPGISWVRRRRVRVMSDLPFCVKRAERHSWAPLGRCLGNRTRSQDPLGTFSKLLAAKNEVLKFRFRFVVAYRCAIIH